MAERQYRRLRIAGLIVIGVSIIGLSVMSLSPEAMISIFGEWGYRHLISTDKKVEMINSKFADPDFPLFIGPGSAWSAGLYYPEELLLCKAVYPPEFVLVDLQHEHESAVAWRGADAFSFSVKGYPITITVHVVEVGNNGQARIRIVAEKADQHLMMRMAPTRDYRTSYTPASSKTAMEREFAPLLAIRDNYPKYVVTMDDFWRDNIEGVKHRHLSEFLLMEEYQRRPLSASGTQASARGDRDGERIRSGLVSCD